MDVHSISHEGSRPNAPHRHMLWNQLLVFPQSTRGTAAELQQRTESFEQHSPLLHHTRTADRFRDLHQVILDIRPISQHLGWGTGISSAFGRTEDSLSALNSAIDTLSTAQPPQHINVPLYESHGFLIHLHTYVCMGVVSVGCLCSFLSHTYVKAIKHLTGDGKSVGCGCLPSFRAHYHYLSSAKINQSPRCQRDERWMQLEAQMAGKGHATASRRDHLI